MRWRDFDGLTALPDSFFATPRRVHFVGVGGIGMSALALALRQRGHAVSGSDAGESEMLGKLRVAGVAVAVGHQAGNLELLGALAQALVFNSAIAEANPERVAARERGLPQWHRGQVLAYFVNTAARSVAVSGTHGKSTTSAMVAHILTECGHDPTALLGAVYPPFGSNARLGNPDMVVVEADESDGSFTLLHPTIALVTNVEPEHLENYDYDEAELWRAFAQFVGQARESAIINHDAPPGQPSAWDRLRGPLEDRAETYSIAGLRMVEGGTVHRTNFQGEGDERTYTCDYGTNPIGPFRLGVPGGHNLSNALGAIAACARLGVPPGEAAAKLATFHGVGRRFQLCGEAGGVLVYDDYAHHPTEVASTLSMARDYLRRPLLAIFQPHRYSRTQQLHEAFGPAFGDADEVIVTELYAAFETPIPGVSGRQVFEAVRRARGERPTHFVANLEEARCRAVELARPGSAILTMGAGDISGLPRRLLESLRAAGGSAP